MLQKVTILCLFLSAALGKTHSQSLQVAEIDSATMVYYNKCLAQINSPIVLTMTDTLYEMGRQNKDQRMQAVALCTKLDHYYFTHYAHKADSVHAWTKRVQQFAKKTNQPKYYYFVWASRLIKLYILQGEYNIALLEAEKMLKEAEAEKHEEGISKCYSVMAEIYQMKGLNTKALEFYFKQIEVTEKQQLNDYNISLIYCTAAGLLLDQGKLPKALDLIQKGEKCALSPLHKVRVKLAYVQYYQNHNDLRLAGQKLKECEQIFATDPSLQPHFQSLYNQQVSYYRKKGNYKEALRINKLQEEAMKRKDEEASPASILRTRASIYWEMGLKEETASIYRQLLTILDGEQEKSEKIAVAEFATLLNMQKLTTEKEELEAQSRQEQLQQTRIIIFLLAILLAVLSLFLYRQRKLNRQLKKSRDILNEKNNYLLKTEEELRRAKEAAEESSRMKTTFIQSMSHEIRTPLNAIVGFSAILAEMHADDKDDNEAKEYAGNVERNTRMLLKIINDILDISNLEKDEEPILHSPVDINECCKYAVLETTPLLQQGVELMFNPLPDNPVITSNEELILQVLKNLLDNAAKFTASGNITLSAEIHKEEKALFLSVTDTGIGIAPELHEQVFERFAKQNNFSQGTGLGLSISRLAAEKLDGYLIIDKEYTQGARFVFTIPIEDESTLS